MRMVALEPMTRLTLNIDADLMARLGREARRARCTREELARRAILDCLQTRETAAFLRAIAIAARADGGEGGVALAEEALPIDNESLEVAERRGSQGA